MVGPCVPQTAMVAINPSCSIISVAARDAILTLATEMSLSARTCGGLFIDIEGLDVIYGFETLEELLMEVGFHGEWIDLVNQRIQQLLPEA